MKFKPNDERPPKTVSSIDDIKEYMGEVMDYYDHIERDGNLVLAYMGGQGLCIGTIED